MNRTSRIVLLAAVLIAVAAIPTAAAGPRAVVETPKIDLGQVPRGDSVEARFVIRNDGDEVLRILKVKPG